MSRRWQTALGLLVSVVLIYWALHGISLGEVWVHIRSANMWLLLLAVGIQTSTFLVRAARWSVFLRPALPHARYYPRFASTCIGFMANNLLPARMGEFARAYALARIEPITVSASFGSLVVERIFDAFVLALFLLLPLLVPGFAAPAALTNELANILIILVIVVGAAVALALLIYRPRLAARVFGATLGRLLPQRVADRVTGVIRSFVDGLGTLRSPSLVAAGLVWSIAHWAWAGVSYLVGLAAFDIRPGYVGALFLQGVNGFVVSIPSSPGFFGPFESSVRLALQPFGVDPARAVSFAVAFHLGAFIPVTLLGLYYLGRLGMTWREVEKSEEIVEEARDETDPAAATSRPVH